MEQPNTFFIRPAINMFEEVNSTTGERPRYRIADPQTGEYLPDAGARMPRSGFWLRRLRDNDVEFVEENTQVSSKQETQTPEAKTATAKKTKDKV